MANCTVSGTFTNPQASAISGATIRFNTQTPLLDAVGNLIMPKEITTTTATDGTWSLSIEQGIAGSLTLDLNPTATSPIVKYSFSLVIPATSTATFASCWVDSGTFGGQGTSSPLTFAGIGGTLATAQLPALPSTDVWVGSAGGLAAAVAISGDVSLSNTGAVTINTVGSSTAANIHAAELLANAATDANTLSAIVRRDSSGNFSAGTITAALSGNATTATTAGSFSGSLTGDVTGTQAATKVAAIQGSNVASTSPTDAQSLVYNTSQAKYNPVSISGDATLSNTGAVAVTSVGGSTATLVHSAELAANAATNANTVSTIVKRDGSGNFSAGTITAALTGAASGNTTYTANSHGLVISGSTNAMTVVAPDVSTTKVLVSGGSSADPSWASITNSNLSGSAAITNANLATMASSSSTVGTVKGNISGSSATPSDVTLTSANTVSTAVLRDGSGNFSAGTITAALTGNASTATTATSATSATTATNIAGGVSGSMPYQTAAGTTALLAKGSDTQVLTLASGLPTWATASAGSSTTAGYWSGYFAGTLNNYWTWTSGSYVDFTANGTIPAITQRVNLNMGTVTGAPSSLPGITFTAPHTGVIHVRARGVLQNGGGSHSDIQLYEGASSTVVDQVSVFYNAASSGSQQTITLDGYFSATASTAYTFKLQGKTNGSPLMGNNNAAGDVMLSFTMEYIT